MKRILTLALTALLAPTLLAALAACSTNGTSPTDNPGGTAPAPALVPSGYEITVSEAASLLKANDLRTNLNREEAYPAYHGGQQMRVVHTERGTYTAFVTDFESQTGTGIFVVMKADNEGCVTLLYTGEYYPAGGTTPVNIGQDLNGDVVVALGCGETLSVYVFDHDTDAMTEYTSPLVFASTGDTRHGDGQAPGYQQTMFDFAGRKIYVFCFGGAGTGDFLLEWFTFDMESGRWTETSTYKWIEGVRRHCYAYPFPDGSGGAYIVAERDDLGTLEKDYQGDSKWLFDELRLFYIPDLTAPENITWTTIQEAYREHGHEGDWSFATMGHSGGAFMDADGYLHVTYTLGGGGIEYQYRHAIYKGMECVYNEQLGFLDGNAGYNVFKPLLAQKTDGALYMIVFCANRLTDNVEIYRAEDPLGKTWTPVTVLSTGKDGTAYSMSSPRDGSTQDNVVSGFVYSYAPPDTVHVFTISLDDYSCSDPVDVFEGFDLSQDHMMDTRAYRDSHPTKIIRTEKGTYAAFVYNYVYGDAEQFHIVKIEDGGRTKILYSGEYASRQDAYLSMQRLSDGRICVSVPDGCEIYVIDPDTDEAEDWMMERRKRKERQETDFLVDTEKGETYVFFHPKTNPYVLTGNTLSSDQDLQKHRILQKQTDKDKEYVFDAAVSGRLDDLYMLYNGHGGAYLVGTRVCGVPDVLPAETIRDERGYTVTVYPRENVYSSPIPEGLSYNGRTRTFKDSVELFYIPDLGGNEVKCVTVQPPYEAEGGDGIWSVVDVSESGDVYVDADGKLHVIYAVYRFDFDDADRRGNPALIADTLKHIHAVYDGTALVSTEELELVGVTKETAAGMMQLFNSSRNNDYIRRPAIRMAQTADGTMFLLVCRLGEEDTQIDVYFETEDGWALTASQPIGDFTAESFSVSSPRGGSVEDGTVDCLVYGTDNDVYHVTVTFLK